MKEKMISYLQEMLNEVKKMERKNEIQPNYYRESEVTRVIDAMIACKEMTEALIGEPVNLGLDGKVTVGF